FGSNVDAAFVPLVVPPLVLCAAAALLRARDGASLRFSRAYRTWSIVALAVLMVVAIQLVSLSSALLGLLSPESHAIWSAADRVSGTFVNPNHFAHYAAIVLPFAIYLGAIAWRNAANGRPLTFGRQVAALIERQLFLFVIAAGAALACIAAILLAQSRGALLS